MGASVIDGLSLCLMIAYTFTIDLIDYEGKNVAFTDVKCRYNPLFTN